MMSLTKSEDLKKLLCVKPDAALELADSNCTMSTSLDSTGFDFLLSGIELCQNALRQNQDIFWCEVETDEGTFAVFFLASSEHELLRYLGERLTLEES